MAEHIICQQIGRHLKPPFPGVRGSTFISPRQESMFKYMEPPKNLRWTSPLLGARHPPCSVHHHQYFPLLSTRPISPNNAAHGTVQRDSVDNKASLFFFSFSHTFTFQLLDKPWSQVSSLLPPGSCLRFLSRIGFSNPTARRFFDRMMLTHALALSASQFVHKKKSQRIYTSMHSVGHETDLYQARG